MKKVKQLLMLAVAAAMVLCVTLAPASAATGSDSFTYKQNAYSGYCSLTLEEHGATAFMNCSEGSGAVITDPFCELSGYVFAEDGTSSLEFSAGAEMVRGEKYMSCTGSETLGTKTSDWAYCNYYVNGGYVGNIILR